MKAFPESTSLRPSRSLTSNCKTHGQAHFDLDAGQNRWEGAIKQVRDCESGGLRVVSALVSIDD